jgi:phosphonatase-like hydrolase
MRIELVVFDVAGTTVFDGDAVHRCLETAVGSAGVRTTRDAVNVVMGLPKPLAIARLVAQFRGSSPSAEEVSAIYARFERLMLDHYQRAGDVRPTEGAVHLFQALRTRNVKIALDTGFGRTILDSILERLGWDGRLLDATVATNEVAHGRPDPDMIWRAMKLTGVADANSVGKVGDTPADLEQGRRAGCALVIGVTSGSHTKEELGSVPHTHLIASLSELLPIVDERNGSRPVG